MADRFQQDTIAIVAEIRDLFAQAIESKCQSSAGLPEICQGFGIHRKLAWQLAKVAYGSDPFHAARYMPTPKAMDTWLTSARQHGVEGDLLERIREASSRFEHLIETHAGSRTAMDMLLEACIAQPSEEIDIRWRQRAFEGNGYIWGVQARSLVAFSIIAPSTRKRGWFDIVQVRSIIGLRRMRPDTRWVIGQGAIVRDNETPDGPQRTPLDPTTADRTGGVPVIAAFSSEPLPTFERRAAGHNTVYDELLPGEIGQAGEITITTGEIVRDLAPAFATSQDQRANFGTGVGTPAEALIYDHFVHRDLFVNVKRELCVYGEVGKPFTHDDEDRVRVPERVQHLGSGLARVHAPEAPGYAKLLRHAFDACGWQADDFDLHRVRMAYPPLSTSVMIRHPMPEPPDWLEA